MASSDNVKRLKLRIGTDKVIRVEHTLNSSVGNPTAEINASALQKETISVLTNILREGRLLTEREFRLLGTQLYDVLLTNDIGNVLKRVINERLGYDEQDSDLLRVELEFEENKNKSNAEIKELLGWPWEYLYCSDLSGGMFLSEIAQLVLSRRLYLTDGERDLLIKEQRPRVLFVSASPDDFDPVQGDSILKAFESLGDKIELFKLVTKHEKYDEERTEGTFPETTWQGFKNIVASKKPHIIHFIGHGRFNDEDRQGEIAFVGKDYQHIWINETQLASALIGMNSLHLVFLQACESGKIDKIADTGPYRAISGVASKLAANNIPAIVAMQYKVENALSNAFASEFYQALIESRTIEAAMQQGRAQILDNLRGWSVSRAFGVPVLYLRSSGGLLAPKVTDESSRSAQNAALPVQPPPDQSVCAQCNTRFNIGDDICSECGAYLRCSNQNCKTPIKKKGAKFCTKCGLALQLYPERTIIAGDIARFSKTYK
ncbi:MAG: hypothetical protein NVS4B7_09500 [Ktedonobacteraceae bacterium]